MATVYDVIENIKSFNIEVVAKQSIAATSNIISDLNRKQLLKGEKADNTFFKNYSKTSQELFGKQDIPIQLKDTGEFHDSVDTGVFGDEVITAGKDRYNLEERYGNIYGLHDKNKENYAENTLLPLIQKDFTDKTGLTFS